MKKTRFVVSDIRDELGYNVAQIIVDQMTGVQYFSYDGGITPLITSDGKPLLTNGFVPGKYKPENFKTEIVGAEDCDEEDDEDDNPDDGFDDEFEFGNHNS